MTTTDLGYGVIDADNHYYEPYDCCTRHLESAFADRAVHVVPGDDGLGRLYFGAKRLPFMSVIQTDYIGAPGSLEAFFLGGTENVERSIINAHDHPEFMQRGPRLALMDELGVDAVMMLPTLIDGIEHELRSDPEAMYANIRSYNRWVQEEWGYGEDGRIFATAWMSLVDLELAVQELERVLGEGVRVIHMMPRPIYGRSPADPYFDPFWARAEEAGVAVVFHVGDSGYNEMVSTLWSEPAHPRMQHQSAMQWYLGSPERAITDTLAALVLHNLFGRFPQLKIASIENGAAWLRDLLGAMDKAAKMASGGQDDWKGAWLGGPITDAPSEIFREHIYVAPFFEEDPTEAIELIGAEHVLFGSDFPHPEGLLHPVDFAKKLAGVSEHDRRLVMRENAARLLGIPA